MKVDSYNNQGDINEYFKSIVTRAVCDAYHIVETSSNKDKNFFVKINISKEVDDFIKSMINDSKSLTDAYEEAKYIRPSFKSTIEKEYTAIYNKYKRMKNELFSES